MRTKSASNDQTAAPWSEAIAAIHTEVSTTIMRGVGVSGEKHPGQFQAQPIPAAF
jgi:hypothetical protein